MSRPRTSVVLLDPEVGGVVEVDPPRRAGGKRSLLERRGSGVARHGGALDPATAATEAFLAALRELWSLESVARTLELTRGGLVAG